MNPVSRRFGSGELKWLILLHSWPYVYWVIGDPTNPNLRVGRGDEWISFQSAEPAVQ
ncbi:MAG: hypothetical protein R3B07_23330 [Polyangiaceae bacterium]